MSTRFDVATRRADADHYIYRCYDADGDLIYIGCTANVARRIAAHRRGDGRAVASRWLSTFMASHEVTGPFRGHEAGRDAERLAINLEQPLFNQQERAGLNFAAWMTREPVARYLVARGYVQLAIETTCSCSADYQEVGEINPTCHGHLALARSQKRAS